jgi:CO/xanthine dehydrogenase FAD-binding subunit
MNLWNSYYCAKTIEDALQALSSAEGEACVIAGGTDLLLDMQQGRHAPVDRLVDITAVPDMCCLEVRGSMLYVGAAVPITQIVRSPLVQQHAMALVEAADLIGGPQVRNTATLGGNVAHALPAADGTIALLALAAQAEIADLNGRKLVPLQDLFLGPGKSRLAPHTELLTGFYLPLQVASQGSAFRRVMRPQGVALPILNLAAWLWREGDHIREIRISLGPAGPTPQRASQAEAILEGQALDGTVLSKALDAILEQARFRTSPHRSTSSYRRHLVGGLLKDVLDAAWERAG